MTGDYEDRMLRVLDFIYENLDADLSLDRLAEVAAMSRFHWHRVFHGMTGETLAQAVRRARMHRAACLLARTDQPLREIGKACGYDSPESFARAFRAGYGQTPMAFRNRGLTPPPISIKDGKDASMLDTPPTYEITIRDMPGYTLAALPHTGPYIEIGQAFEKLSAIVSSRGLWEQVQGMIGVYYDDPSAVPEEKLRSHAGLITGADFPMEPPLEVVTLHSGPHGILLFKGPYAGLKSGYDYLYGTWLPQSGKTPADAAPYEIYLNTPMDTAPDDLLTEICLPLSPN
ncbi:MAG: AraC family transcriptional regulator [Pseudomonadota bacterium]